MSPIILTAPAKINLTLDILGKDEKAGMHFLNSFFYRCDSLYDRLTLERIDSDQNEVVCDYPGVVLGKLNTVFKALDVLGKKGWKVTIKKQIPVGAGLGGGSSNAAVVLKHFADEKGIPLDHLHDMARQIGADVPFFLLEENLAYAEGFGDQIMQSWMIDPLPIEIIQTSITVSTAEAYANLDLKQCGKDSVKTEGLLKLLQEGTKLTPKLLEPYVHNDFEDSFFENHPQVKGKGHLCGSGGSLWDFV